MMKRLRQAMMTFLPAAIAVLLMASPAAAFDLFGDACNSQNQQAQGSPTCQQASSEGSDTNNRVTGPKNIINTAANILALASGIGAVIMILIGAFKFVAAGGATPGQRAGDPNAIKSARSTITAAIIGLTVIALAWSITRFITDKLIQ